MEPKLSNFNELFEGTVRDRDLLTKEELEPCTIGPYVQVCTCHTCRCRWKRNLLVCEMILKQPSCTLSLPRFEENDALNKKIRQLLLLLSRTQFRHNAVIQGVVGNLVPENAFEWHCYLRSPHLQARAAQECIEGLLYRWGFWPRINVEPKCWTLKPPGITSTVGMWTTY